jgi:hypothetical protein
MSSSFTARRSSAHGGVLYALRRARHPIRSTAPSATANTANCFGGFGTVTDVGAYTGAASPAGTFDQLG